MISLKQRHPAGKKDESGIVSLIIVGLLSIIIALIAVGFSKLADRELRQASERELAAQAYYSAKSGVNDALAYIQAGGFSLSGCSDWQTAAFGPQNFVTSISPAAKYTCVSVSRESDDLIYSLKAWQSKTIVVNAPAMRKLYFSWEKAGQVNTGSPLGNLGYLPQETDPIFNNAATTGILRVGLYPTSSAPTDNNALAADSRTYFLYPCAQGSCGGPSQVNYAAGGYNPASGPNGNNGSFLAGDCLNGNGKPFPKAVSAPRYCDSSIVGLKGGGSDTYYIHLTAMYTDLNVTIQGTDNGNNPTAFDGAQGIVDVTGQGTNVIQRIRARVDLSKSYELPDYALQSMDTLCKGFQVDVAGPNQYGSSVDNSAISPYGSCAAPSDGGSVANNATEIGPH